MFNGCYGFTAFSSDLSSLTYGNYMFNYCLNLTSFNSDLPNLTSGDHMFEYCYNLKSFSIDLPSLTSGSHMFKNCPLTSFSTDLSKLTNGTRMFDGCTNLESFSSDLSNLTDGNGMFYYCTALTSFTSKLTSLMNGSSMFLTCKLDTASVQNIADTINKPSSKGTIHIGIGNSTPNDQEESAFNKIASRNWTVYVNGYYDSDIWNPTALTPENGEESITPIPFWAKPVPTTEESARYVDENGNYYDILGGQFIYGDDISTYGMFTCEEDAAANMRLTPYIKPQTEIEKQ